MAEERDEGLLSQKLYEILKAIYGTTFIIFLIIKKNFLAFRDLRQKYIQKYLKTRPF